MLMMDLLLLSLYFFSLRQLGFVLSPQVPTACFNDIAMFAALTYDLTLCPMDTIAYSRCRP